MIKFYARDVIYHRPRIISVQWVMTNITECDVMTMIGKKDAQVRCRGPDTSIAMSSKDLVCNQADFHLGYRLIRMRLLTPRRPMCTARSGAVTRHDLDRRSCLFSSFHCSLSC